MALCSARAYTPKKASGALSADEIAVLSLVDLSLESVVSLADVPIPGFPETCEASRSSPGQGREEKSEALAGADGVGDTREVQEREEEKDAMEFAYADLGASVVECSSNSESSGGLLQVRDKIGLFDGHHQTSLPVISWDVLRGVQGCGIFYLLAVLGAIE